MHWNITKNLNRNSAVLAIMLALFVVTSCGELVGNDDPWIRSDGTNVRGGITRAEVEVSVSSIIVDDVVGRRPSLMIEVTNDEGTKVERCIHAMISNVRNHLVKPGENFEVVIDLDTVRNRYCVEHGYLNVAIGEATADGNVKVTQRSRRLPF